MSGIANRLRRFLHSRPDRREQLRTALLVTAVAAVLTLLTVVGLPAGSSPVPTGPDHVPPPTGQADDTGSPSLLPAGAPPGVDYLLDRTYVFADGDRVQLDIAPGSVLDAAPYRDGVVVTVRSPTAGSSEVANHLWFTRDGRLEHVGCGGEEVVLSSDGAQFAYARTVRDCDRWGRWPVLQRGSTEDMRGTPRHLEARRGQRVEPVGVGRRGILFNVVDATGGRSRGVYIMDKVGDPVEVGGIARAAAWEPATGRVAGCPSVGPCAVVDDRTGAVELTLDPGEEPLSFSPDGQHLATARGDGEGPITIALLDVRTGRVLATSTGDPAAFRGDDSVAWEGTDALLIATVDTDGARLVRLGTDGSTELATPSTEPTTGGFLLPGS